MCNVAVMRVHVPVCVCMYVCERERERDMVHGLILLLL